MRLRHPPPSTYGTISKHAAHLTQVAAMRAKTTVSWGPFILVPRHGGPLNSVRKLVSGEKLGWRIGLPGGTPGKARETWKDRNRIR